VATVAAPKTPAKKSIDSVTRSTGKTAPRHALAHAYYVVGIRGRCRVVLFERLAVTPEQVEEWSLPTRPTKRTDTRARGFTGDSVEVDAVPANVLRTLVEDAIRRHVDARELHVLDAAEADERQYLTALAGGVR
jgi:hypothetical protein